MAPLYVSTVLVRDADEATKYHQGRTVARRRGASLAKQSHYRLVQKNNLQPVHAHAHAHVHVHVHAHVGGPTLPYLSTS